MVAGKYAPPTRSSTTSTPRPAKWSTGALPCECASALTSAADVLALFSRGGFAEADASHVRVITEYMGGGFGSKLGFDRQVVVAARLAKAAGAGVKMMLSRKEEHLVTGNRPSAYARVKAGADSSGKLVAFDADEPAPRCLDASSAGPVIWLR